MNVKSICHAVCGDIVMGRPDAAGREQIVVARAQDVDRLDDGFGPVGDNADFSEADALRVKPDRDLCDILVLGSPRQDCLNAP